MILKVPGSNTSLRQGFQGISGRSAYVVMLGGGIQECSIVTPHGFTWWQVLTFFAIYEIQVNWFWLTHAIRKIT
jgi:hypothetical protein